MLDKNGLKTMIGSYGVRVRCASMSCTNTLGISFKPRETHEIDKCDSESNVFQFRVREIKDKR